jgi:hypothetical protein
MPQTSPGPSRDTILAAATDLANWQILLLQSRISGTPVILESAKQKMSEADSLVPEIKYTLQDIQTRRSDLENAPRKIGGAVENFKWENRDITQCVKTRQDLADEQYAKGVETLEKEIADMEKEVFKVPPKPQPQQQQNNQGQKDYTKMSREELEKELENLEKRYSDPNIKDEKKKNLRSTIDKVRALIKSKRGGRLTRRVPISSRRTTRRVGF